jgi:hypothetical protein
MEITNNEGEQQSMEVTSGLNDGLGGLLNTLRCPDCESFNTYILLRPQHRLVTKGDAFWYIALSEKVCEMCGHRWDHRETEGMHVNWR